MNDPTLRCPNCHTTIPLTESLAAPLIEATRTKYEQLISNKDRDIANREASLRGQQAELQKAKEDLEKQVASKLAAERIRISAEESAKARVVVAADLNQKTKDIGELQAVLKQRDEKLAEAQKAQADVIRRERELEDAKREIELTIEKKVQSSLDTVRTNARMEAEEALRLRVSEREEQIASMQRQIDDLKRKAEQGSQQLQGEVLELELEGLLRARFPQDSIEPVPKGDFGGDVLQFVMNSGGQSCGTIIWEAKRTKNWADGWLPKLRDDQRKAKADVALIVSSVLPKGIQTFDQVDGVWVTHPRCALPIAIALRQSLLELAAARLASEGRQTKTELVYAYLTGPRFRQRIEAIVEKFTEMQSDLDKERRAMTRMWAKRDAQIRGVIDATAGMYGDLQGIAGNVLEAIDAFALPMIEDRSDDDDTIAG